MPSTWAARCAPDWARQSWSAWRSVPRNVSRCDNDALWYYTHFCLCSPAPWFSTKCPKTWFWFCANCLNASGHCLHPGRILRRSYFLVSLPHHAELRPLRQRISGVGRAVWFEQKPIREDWKPGPFRFEVGKFSKWWALFQFRFGTEPELEKNYSF